MGSFRLIENHFSFKEKQAFRCLLFIWEIWEIWGAGKGMLQSRRVLKFDGAIAPRVLKFDSGSAAEGCGGRLTFIEGALL